MEDLELLATRVYEAFNDAYSNVHATVNRSENVEYPYVTFDLRTDPTLARNQENLVIDVQVFDNISSYSRAYAVASKLRNHFKGLLTLDDALHIRYDVQRGISNWHQVPTNDPNIIRLEGTLQAKLDWRENR